MINQDLNKFYRTRFKDFDIDLQLESDTGDIKKYSHIDSVKRRIKTLVLTVLYDRPYQPALGSQLSGLLFEFAESDLLDLGEEMLVDLIRAFEPSIGELTVHVTDIVTGNGFRVFIEFTIIDHHEEASLEIIYNKVR